MVERLVYVDPPACAGIAGAFWPRDSLVLRFHFHRQVFQPEVNHCRLKERSPRNGFCRANLTFWRLQAGTLQADSTFPAVPAAGVPIRGAGNGWTRLRDCLAWPSEPLPLVFVRPRLGCSLVKSTPRRGRTGSGQSSRRICWNSVGGPQCSVARAGMEPEMTDEQIIVATSSAVHDRRLFRLHNHLVDRLVLGYPARGLRLISSRTSSVDRSMLICRFRVLNEDSRQFVWTYKVADFAGIEFATESTHQNSTNP